MQIVFINNDGAGFADKIDVADGLTVQGLFAERVPQGKPHDYLIRVNRQPTTADYVLQPGDRVSITPTKIEGAWRGRPPAGRRPYRLSPPKGLVWEPDTGSTACFSGSPWSLRG